MTCVSFAPKLISNTLINKSFTLRKLVSGLGCYIADSSVLHIDLSRVNSKLVNNLINSDFLYKFLL